MLENALDDPKLKALFEGIENRASKTDHQKTKRQKAFWETVRDKDLRKFAGIQIKRCRQALYEKNMFYKHEDIKDIVWDCIGDCQATYDPAEAKFSTYLSSAVDNAIKDLKDKIAKKFIESKSAADIIPYNWDFQVKVPEAHAKLIDFLKQKTRLSKAEVLRSVMAWALFVLTQTNLENSEKGTSDGDLLKRYYTAIYNFTERHIPEHKTLTKRTFKFDGYVNIHDLFRKAQVKPSAFLTAAIGACGKWIQDSSEEDTINIIHTLPSFRAMLHDDLIDHLS